MEEKETIFEGIMADAKEICTYTGGEADLFEYKVRNPKDLDFMALREPAGQTQEDFALRYGFNPTAPGY